MTQDEIIEMARKAGICSWFKPPEDVKDRLEIFAKLVAAKAIEQRTWVGLTTEDWYEFAKAQLSWEELLIAAETKLKLKNGYAEEKNT